MERRYIPHIWFLKNTSQTYKSNINLIYANRQLLEATISFQATIQ